jgi:RNA polymerase sigma-70 factor (ECF subfamily)
MELGGALLESQLIERIKRKDKEAFKELYNLYANQAIRTAIAITKSNATASDVVQETFIRVYKNIDRFDNIKAFKPWFYKILINECNRVMKTSSNVVYLEDSDKEAISGSSADMYEFQEYEDLYTAIKSLDDDVRIPIVLKYLKGFKEEEIADILTLNLNTVKSRLFRGRQKLKAAITKLSGRSELNG